MRGVSTKLWVVAVVLQVSSNGPTIIESNMFERKTLQHDYSLDMRSRIDWNEDPTGVLHPTRARTEYNNLCMILGNLIIVRLSREFQSLKDNYTRILPLIGVGIG